jgi:polysaccharide deacetylase family protein (PEP-CTERM system associated)
MVQPARTGILTIDVEEWFHAHNYASRVGAETWNDRSRRAGEGVDALLQVCDDLGIRATFFILGWLAEQDPQLVRRIAAAGHEIGSHSYAHPIVYELDPEAFREDTRRGRDAVAQALGEAPVAYRAPSFTIVPQSYWALRILQDEGFRVDSSLFPVRHPRYGNPQGPRTPFRLGEGDDTLLVLPMTTLRVGSTNWAFSGGGYFRLLPLPLLKTFARRVQSGQGEPVVYYFHPWELDSHRPDVDLGWLQNLRSQGGKKDLYAKLKAALNGQKMITLGEWAASQRETAPVVADVDAIPGALTGAPS